MAKVIARLGIKKRKGYLYFIDKNGNVAETKMAQFDDGSSLRSSAMDGLATKKKAAPKKATAKKATAKKATAKPKKVAAKKATAKKAAPKKAAPKRVMVQTAYGKWMDSKLKAMAPGRRVSKTGRKYSENRINRAD